MTISFHCGFGVFAKIAQKKRIKCCKISKNAISYMLDNAKTFK